MPTYALLIYCDAVIALLEKNPQENLQIKR
jgi:hypothetical protein